MLFQKVQQIYLSNEYDFFSLILLLTNHEALFTLIIVLSFHLVWYPASLCVRKVKESERQGTRLSFHQPF